MWMSLAAAEVLDREFLSIRAKLIELAAAADRVQRADSPKPQDTKVNDPRADQIRQCLEVLLSDSADRTAQLQSLFSLPYQENWQKEYGL